MSCWILSCVMCDTGNVVDIIVISFVKVISGMNHVSFIICRYLRPGGCICLAIVSLAYRAIRLVHWDTHAHIGQPRFSFTFFPKVHGLTILLWMRCPTWSVFYALCLYYGIIASLWKYCRSLKSFKTIPDIFNSGTFEILVIVCDKLIEWSW